MNNRLLFVACLCFIWATWESTASADLQPFGVLDDEQTSIVYYPETGEIAVDALASRELIAISIDSAAGILITEQLCSVARELGITLVEGSFNLCPVEDIDMFKANMAKQVCRDVLRIEKQLQSQERPR